MIIAYIHGFCSSSKAKKAQIMKIELLKNYKDIKFVSLDFSDNFKIAMEELNEQIQSLLKEDPKVCLAASSLGGFMAMLLSIKYDLKVALVNPCLYPCKRHRDRTAPLTENNRKQRHTASFRTLLPHTGLCEYRNWIHYTP